MNFDWHPRYWVFRKEVAPSGFWVVYFGPWIWWGKGVRSASKRSRDDAMV